MSRATEGFSARTAMVLDSMAFIRNSVYRVPALNRGGRISTWPKVRNVDTCRFLRPLAENTDRVEWHKERVGLIQAIVGGFRGRDETGYHLLRLFTRARIPSRMQSSPNSKAPSTFSLKAPDRTTSS